MPRKILKVGPRVARELTGSGALPKTENLLRKSPEELIKTLNRFGIQPDLKAIDLRARRAFLQLNEILAEGKMPSDAAFERLAKVHTNELSASLRQMTKQAIRLYKMNLNDTKGGGLEVWITSGNDNVCPDCEPLHGVIKTHAEWVRLGLPGTSKHVCRAECNCELLPAGDAR